MGEKYTQLELRNGYETMELSLGGECCGLEVDWCDVCKVGGSCLIES
jgi:hypothetical protein